MSTLKAIREIKRRAMRDFGVVGFKAETASRHIRLTVTHSNGRTQKLVMASSPRNEHASIELTVIAIKRFKGKRQCAASVTPPASTPAVSARA